MSETSEPYDAPKPDVLAALKSMNWEPDKPPEPPKEGETDQDPMAALNFGEHNPEEATRIPLPEEAFQDIAPPEKERVLREDNEPQKVKDPWVRNIPELGVVRVTDVEKDAYQIALLQEQRFETVIDLQLGSQTVSVGLRSLYDSEKAVIALAVQKAVENSPLKTLNNVAMTTSAYFKAMILCSVTGVAGKPQVPFEALVPNGEYPVKSPLVEELEKRIHLDFGNVHQHRFRLLMRAIHVFEVKQLILEDAVGNQDFWVPADAN